MPMGCRYSPTDQVPHAALPKTRQASRASAIQSVLQIPEGTTLTYSLEGTDQASFALDDDQLQTRSDVTYNYEEKNSYEVTVRVEDGQGGSNAIEVTINLTDVQEPPETPAIPKVQAASSTSLTVTWTAPRNTGPDITDYDVQYREGDSGNFTDWPHTGTGTTATITGRSPDTSYEVQVRATNAEGTSNWSNSGTGSTGANGLPIFTDGSSATRSFAENTTGIQKIGDPVTATDPENTTLTYSLEGQDADAFTIDTSSGQLRTTRDETYNYEDQNRYVVRVKATDGHSGERTISVNIDLTDVNEAPTFTSDATFEAAENNSFAGQVTAEDVDSGDGITGYEVTGGADRNQFEITNTNQLHFKDAPNFEDPADNGRNNEYIVEVTATGGTEGRALTAAADDHRHRHRRERTASISPVMRPSRSQKTTSLSARWLLMISIETIASLATKSLAVMTETSLRSPTRISALQG